ncbi:MAG: SPOR domain-containing protein [Gammaproteobacteria bacterium]|nr:SPOR domain-containing protein [Gammaproteobacteria bacterium]
MAKDYAKFVPAKSWKPKRKIRLAGIFIAVFFFVFVCLGAAYSFVIMKKNNAVASRAADLHAFITNVVLSAMHKNDGLIRASVKKMAENSQPPVHFDFYSELPKMQLTLTETQDTPSPSNKAPSTHYEVGVKTGLTTAEDTQPAAPKPAVVEPAPPPAPVKVIQPDELSGLIAEEAVQKSQYVLQLGVFETRLAANKLQEALISVGFNPVVVKLHAGKYDLYELQQGPFTDLQMAKATKSRLQKRGITSVIHKTG